MVPSERGGGQGVGPGERRQGRRGRPGNRRGTGLRPGGLDHPADQAGLKGAEGRSLLVLRWLADYQRRMGYMPTLREIQVAFGLASTNGARYYISILVRLGYVTPGARGLARTTVITPAG